MGTKQSQTLTVFASTLAVVAFLLLSTGAVVWANGLRYDPATGTFQQTVLVAVDGGNQDVNFSLNGQLISDHIPYRARNLLPDHYLVELSKPDFQTWRQSFWLSKGQVGVITDPTLIATAPLVTEANNSLTIPAAQLLDFGLSLTSGELTDQGALVTRFSQTPSQIHRLNGYYLYQEGNQLRLFLPAGSQDFLAFTASSNAAPLPLVLYPSTWQIAVNDGGAVKLVNLTIAGSSGP